MALRSCASKLITSSQSVFSNSEREDDVDVILNESEYQLRYCSPTLVKTEKLKMNHPTVNRGIHSTSVTRMGGHGHDEPFYLHAKHMYNLDRMSNQKLKMTLGVWSAVAIGVIVPVYAVVFQQKKTASG